MALQQGENMANAEPNSGLERPYRVVGYPFVPLLYVAIALFFIVYIIIGDPVNSGKGVFLILTGLPVYFYWKKKLSR